MTIAVFLATGCLSSSGREGEEGSGRGVGEEGEGEGEGEGDGNPVPDPPPPEEDAGGGPDSGPDDPIPVPPPEPKPFDCEKVCGHTAEVCGPAAEICKEICEQLDEESRDCVVYAGGCGEIFECIGDVVGPAPDPGPRPGPPPNRRPCDEGCRALGDNCGFDLEDRCDEVCNDDGLAFPQACVDRTEGDCDLAAACFGTPEDICDEVCPAVEEVCPGILEDCEEQCARAPEPAAVCLGEAEDCGQVLDCLLDEYAGCQAPCVTLERVCEEDFGDCIGRCEAGDMPAEERICAEGARSCRQYAQCLNFVDADCIGACAHVEDLCPGEDEDCQVQCARWEEETQLCVQGVQSCDDYAECTEHEEDRPGGPPDVPGAEEVDEICDDICNGLIRECDEANATCRVSCRAVSPDDWACVVGAGDDCEAVSDCLADAAEQARDQGLLCDDVCDQVRRADCGPVGFFCEELCLGLDEEGLECIEETNPQRCNNIAECLGIGFIGGGGRGGGP